MWNVWESIVCSVGRAWEEEVNIERDTYSRRICQDSINYRSFLFLFISFIYLVVLFYFRDCSISLWIFIHLTFYPKFVCLLLFPSLLALDHDCLCNSIFKLILKKHRNFTILNDIAGLLFTVFMK